MATAAEIKARQDAVRAAGYTGEFGAGGGDAFLMQKYGSTATPVAKPLSGMIQPAAATPTPAGYWNSDVAASLAQVMEIIPEGTVAKGGYLDAKLAELQKTDPQRVAEFNKIALGIQQGTMSPDLVMNYFIERETKKQSTDPEYGSLAKAPYQKFTPYGEKAPEFKPFALSDFMASPDYEFRKAEGQRAINRAGSARGNFYSGGALKEAADLGSNLAAGEFQNARNNYNEDFATKYGQYGDAYNRYNTNFGLGYGQARDDSNTLYNRYAGLAGAGAGTANAAVQNNNVNSDLVGTTLAASAQNKANAGIASANNLSQILANSFGNSSYKRKTS
jgi:hypothetical protein